MVESMRLSKEQRILQRLMYIVFHPSGTSPLASLRSTSLPPPLRCTPRLVRAKHPHSRGLTKFLELLKFLHKKDTLWKGQTTQLSAEHHDESLPSSYLAKSF